MRHPSAPSLPRLLLPLLLAMALLAPQTTNPAASPVALAQAPAAVDTQATLLSWSTVARLLAGEVRGGIDVAAVQQALAAYPPDWPLVGVGTTSQAGRNGELMPDGLAGAPRLWWADPGSPSEAAVIDLAAPKSAPPGVRLPYLALAVGNPATAFELSGENVADVHAWLTERLAAAGVGLAGVQVRGSFGPVQTTVAHYLPPSGLDLSGGYVGADYFRFGDYAPAVWTLNGLYAADLQLQPVIAGEGVALHLHGYQPATMRGGHITRAAARQITVTVWPLDATAPQATRRIPDRLAGRARSEAFAAARPASARWPHTIQ